ncbi:MAG: hypothetical protein IKU07_09825 [Oscillospiraceae bacterium]|nr:hypothetical protein [Oscillospiraceae bacterium]
MQKIRISDITMKQSGEGFELSFKNKIELSKLLDKLGVSVIELEGIENPRVDSLRIKSIAAVISGSVLAVPVQLDEESVVQTWNALQQARYPRLQVCAPVSSVQMEYLFHKKPEVMLESIRKTVEKCKELCTDVEFMAEDATRADPDYLRAALKTAIDAGATVVTVCDTAGTMLPTEMIELIRKLRADMPQLESVELGIACVNTLSMADACSIAAACEGVRELKTAAYPITAPSLSNVAKVIAAKGAYMGVNCDVQVTQLGSVAEQIAWMCQSGKRKVTATEQNDTSDIYLTAHDDAAAVAKVVESLGYDLSQDIQVKIYESFCQIAEKKEQVSARELDAIAASVTMQVPSAYRLDTYLITSGNTISATAHIKLIKNGQPVEGVYIGDGSIDAAFQAIENITGCHYELDDFQLQAVTKGREAMGQTVVKLRSGGKVYTGEGLSTDIVGAGIRAYLSALNKIVYEEGQA